MGRKKIFADGSKTLCLRITKRQKDMINLLVRAGRYKDQSQFVRCAIEGYLKLENLEGARVFMETLEGLKKNE